MPTTKFSNFKLILLLSITILMFSSCLRQQKVVLLQDKGAKSTGFFENDKKSAYTIQSGDNLFIKIYSVDVQTNKFFQNEFPQLMNPTYLYLNSYTVNDSGYIDFSFIDKVHVKGLTVEMAKALIQKKLSEYFKSCSVTVRLVNFRVTVLGEVKHPGEFEVLKDQLTVLQAIGNAEGFTDFANRSKVTLIRQVPGGSDVHLLDLTSKKFLKSEYYYLLPNDVLYVEPLGSQRYAYTRFPFEVLLTALSTGLLFWTVFKK